MNNIDFCAIKNPSDEILIRERLSSKSVYIINHDDVGRLCRREHSLQLLHQWNYGQRLQTWASICVKENDERLSNGGQQSFVKNRWTVTTPRSNV